MLGLKRCAILLLGTVLFGSMMGTAAEGPLRYELDLRDTSAHLVHVKMDILQSPSGAEVQFPAWNNLYQILDFVRDVQDLSATCDGRQETLKAVDLDTWASPEACTDLELNYEVYANQPGPFSAELNSHGALLNFALLLFYMPKDRERPVRVQFQLPEGWKLVTLLDDGPSAGEYQAADYDRLADSPAIAGKFAEYDYDQSGADYRVIIDADPSDYNAKALLRGLKKITSTETAMMQNVPFKRYTFIFDFPRAPVGGGMEHAYGTVIYVPANETRLSLSEVYAVAAHEFFHLWNVKRIRPQGLEPINYVHGNDTRDLWFCEGVTNTFEELTLLRAGLIKKQEFYKHLASAIQELRSRPARFYQSVEAAGLDAWLEKYPDYFRPERSISYYNKGELLGDLLDIGIVQGSAERYSLDDLMRRLDKEFAQRRRFYTDADLVSIVKQLAPDFPVAAFFRDDVDGTKPLDFATYFGEAGLDFKVKEVHVPDLGFKSLKSFTGPVQVQTVSPQSSAALAGLQPGDILVKMNGQFLLSIPDRQLEGMKPGDQVIFSIERAGHSLDVTFPLGSKTADKYEVNEMRHASKEQRAVRRGWLDGKTLESSRAGN